MHRTHLISSPLAMAFEQRRQHCYAASRGSTAIGWQLVRSGRFVLSLKRRVSTGGLEQLAFMLTFCFALDSAKEQEHLPAPLCRSRSSLPIAFFTWNIPEG
jgi:hypothetical protein